MTVDELLDRHTAKQLAEWAAYEIATGPLDSRWRDDVLASIQEQLQSLQTILGAAHFTSEEKPDNPIPLPIPVPRPWELSNPPESGEELSEDG